MDMENKDKKNIQINLQKPRSKVVKPGSQSLLGKINQRFPVSGVSAIKVVPGIANYSLQTVTEDVAENDTTADATNFQTLNIEPRKSKLFIRPPSARATAKSPRSKSISPKGKDKTTTVVSDNTANGVKLLKYLRKRNDRATFNGFDNSASSLSPSESQRNQEEIDEVPPRPSTAVERIPSAKLRTLPVQAPAHSILSSMFGATSSPPSPRSESMSPRTPPRDADNPTAVYSTPQNDSTLLSQEDESMAVSADQRPLSAKPQPSLPIRPSSTLASLFNSFSPRQDSAPASSEDKNPLSELERPISAEQQAPSTSVPVQTNGLLASLFDSFSPRQDSSSKDGNPLSELERPISAVQRVPSAKLRSPPTQARPTSTLATIFGSFSPRQDSAPASSEDKNPLSELERPISAVQEMSSTSVPVQTNGLLASLFDSFSPRQDSTPASSFKSEVDMNVPSNTHSFHAPRRVGIERNSLVIPAKLEGLGLGRRMSGLTPRTPRSDDDFHSPRGDTVGNRHDHEMKKDKSEGKNIVNSTEVSPSQLLEDRLAKFRASVAVAKNPIQPSFTTTDTTTTTTTPKHNSSNEAGKPPPFLSAQAIEDRLAKFRSSVANKQSPVSVVNNATSSSVVRQPTQGIEERIQNYKKTVAILATKPTNSPTPSQSAPIGSALTSLFLASNKTDDDDADILSFDTAVSMSSTHPSQPLPSAIGGLSSQLLSKLFDDADDDEALDDPETYRRSTHTPTAAPLPLVTPASKPTTPIWLEPEQPNRPRVDERNSVKSVKSISGKPSTIEAPAAPYELSMKVANDHDPSLQTSKPVTPLLAQGKAAPLHPRPSRVPRAMAGGGSSVSAAQAQTQETTTEQEEKKSRLPRRRPL